MAIKKRFVSKYTQTPNDILNHPGLTFKAKGIWGYLNSKPEQWDYSVKGATSQSKDGRDSVTSGMKELEEARYLKRVPRKSDSGEWNGVDYDLYDEPFSVNDETGNGLSDNGEPVDHSNTILSNKEEVKQIEELFANEPVQDISKEVLKYLNDVKPGATPFQFTSTNLNLIKTRIKEKFTIDDFKCVIDYKIAEWKVSDKMKKYIRPKTLFGTKFGDYVVESKDIKPGTDGSGNFEYKPQETPELI